MIPEKYEYRGKWRLPESSQRLEGTLRCNNNDAIMLELEGYFDERRSPYYETIFGETIKGEKITVVDANINGSELFPNTGSEIRKYICELILIGEHFNRFNEIKFDKLYLDSTYLTEWMLPTQTFFKDFYANIAESKNDKGRIYKIEEKKIAYEVKLDSIHSKLIFNLDLRLFGDLQKSCEFKYISYIIIEPEEPKHFNWYMDLIDNVCNFLALLINHPVYPGSLQGETGCKGPVSIHFSTPEPRISRSISRQEIDIRFSDLLFFQKKIYINVCINNWFEKITKLKPIYELFHMISYTPILYRETRFLTLMQALEAFCEEDNYIESAKWKCVRDELIGVIPEILDEIPSCPEREDLIENIGNKIRYGNNFSLKTKMKKLFNLPHLNYLRGIYGGFRDERIKRICDSRDYLTHHGNDYKEKMLPDGELDEVNEILNLSLRVLILNEIGIPCEIVNDIIKKRTRLLKYYFKRDHPF